MIVQPLYLFASCTSEHSFRLSNIVFVVPARCLGGSPYFPDDAMSDLAASSSCPDWTAAYASYNERILAHSKTGKRRAKLVELDGFVRNDIPTRLEARLANDDSGASNRPDGYLTKEEVCKIVEWKITVRAIVCLLGQNGLGPSS